jgi:hypothetical protein
MSPPMSPNKMNCRQLRISIGPDVGDVVDSVESIEAFAPQHGPGRYDVDEHAADPFPGSLHVARAWGHVIHRQDGSVVTEPHPWLK